MGRRAGEDDPWLYKEGTQDLNYAEGQQGKNPDSPEHPENVGDPLRNRTAIGKALITRSVHGVIVRPRQYRAFGLG